MNTLVTLACLYLFACQCLSESQRLTEPTDEVQWTVEQGKLVDSFINPLITLTNIFMWQTLYTRFWRQKDTKQYYINNCIIMANT